MRTLLIDNHDSFTYNLFHLLAEVNGQEPEVLLNDDQAWRPEHLDGFDSVVVSPGPGHPGRGADFGICRSVVAQGRVPVLGVCLGHQGMAHGHGGLVRRGPAFHGRISGVHHDGQDLFAGLPSPFHAVRYHSLVVDDLPPELAATAWTEDGLLMGLRHRAKPLWGVQFHPESVGSEHGLALLANFRRVATLHNTAAGRARSRPVRTAHSVQTAADRTAVRELTVLTRAVRTPWSGEQAYDQLFRGGDHAYWLDSSGQDRPDARFSIMGDASGPLGRVASADVRRDTVTVRSAGDTEVVPGGFLEWLDADLRGARTRVPALPTDFALGWVGYLGYELKVECGGSTGHRADTPDAVMVFSDRALVVDHHTGTTHLLALAEDDATSATATAWLDHAEEVLAGPTPVLDEVPDVPAEVGPLLPRHGRDAYLSRIAVAQLRIAAGETYEVCLTNMVSADGDVDTWDAYRFLRRTCPSPFGALLEFGDVGVLSTSPERFLRVGADGALESSPIKGTRPRGETPEQDRALAEDLANDPKDRAENLMIVDLVRNDLGRCARIGSVTATDVFRVETYSTVHQLVSTVRATARPGIGAVDCVRAAFPPGSMTGAPKERTMRIIDELEGGARGVYSGAVGYFSLTGAADLSVAIRTTVVTPGRITYGVGGAVIALSDPCAEFDETVVKARPLIRLTGRGLVAAVGEPATTVQSAAAASLSRTTALSSSQ
ncbi:aminodeoxychorismate synthase component I [Actinokineospora globicatena]|uniref:aminodeoxychorismate synthase component I n=1 Tax=Actinokineospora globicatena TaxID=103729 RepID=UPI0020A268AB|nr:aminodeoxychorismate synthase component I [Actinokineospora globicatena]MCP2303177.1 para-aminobenzoate synthetase [Actinokineospora globicatena]GLW79706.1 aminodeoxychorismate synthase, component I [Actinokineospora globicatena]GLW85884.1 aminodeoxychorismate synthase, component I [Actinokineospora globicatena]